jgi:hypothetical protein
MGFLDFVVGRAFRNEKAGRVVVFSGAPSKRGYLVKSEADELRIRSFLKMFYFAHFSILVLGIMVANSWSMFLVQLRAFGRPGAHLLTQVGISFGAYMLVVLLPYFLLWRSYRKALLNFVSAQDEIPVSTNPVGQLRWTVLLAMIAVGTLLLLGGLVFLVRAKP